jgi:hypothetical protein
MTDTDTVYVKDPDAVLDYRWDWSAWLDDDTIDTHQVTVAGGVDLDSDSSDDTSVTAWISGGTHGDTATATARVTTTQGRTDDRTITLSIRQR